MAPHEHDHQPHAHETDLKAGLMGLFVGILFIGAVVYGISRWTSSLFAGHG
jgi:hypothetical protein